MISEHDFHAPVPIFDNVNTSCRQCDLCFWVSDFYRFEACASRVVDRQGRARQGVFDNDMVSSGVDASLLCFGRIYAGEVFLDDVELFPHLGVVVVVTAAGGNVEILIVIVERTSKPTGRWVCGKAVYSFQCRTIVERLFIDCFYRTPDGDGG